MKTKLSIVFALLLAGCLLLTGCFPGAGGSLFSCGGAAPAGWSGPVLGNDTLYVGTMTGQVIALENVGEPIVKFKWMYPPGGETALASVYGNPAIGDDSIFVGTYDGKVYAFYTENGLPQWLTSYKTGGAIVGSPAISDGTVYIGTSDGGLHAIDAATGTAKPGFAMFQTEGHDEIWATPVVHDGVVYVAAFDGRLYALDAASGDEVWEPFQTGGAIACTPLIHDDVIYFGSFDRKFYALNKDGSQKWAEPFEADGWFWAKAVAYDGTVIVASLDGRVYALNADTGALVWQYPEDGQVGSIRGDPALVGDLFVLGSEDGKVYALDAVTGVEKWQRDLESPVRASLYGGDGVVFVQASNQKVYAIETEDARPRWVFSTKE